MPFYDFENQATKEVREIWIDQGTPIVYSGDDKHTGTWKKIYSNPHMSIDTKIDPYSKKDFRKVTANKKGLTVGDMWKKSEELSQQRAAKEGVDPVKEKHFRDYEKKTNMKRPAEAKEIAKRGAKDLMKKLGL